VSKLASPTVAPLTKAAFVEVQRALLDVVESIGIVHGTCRDGIEYLELKGPTRDQREDNARQCARDAADEISKAQTLLRTIALKLETFAEEEVSLS